MWDWILVYLVVFFFVFLFQYLATFFDKEEETETAIDESGEELTPPGGIAEDR